jgi:hypothetical protein
LGKASEAVKELTFRGRVHAWGIFGGEVDEDWQRRTLSGVFALVSLPSAPFSGGFLPTPVFG